MILKRNKNVEESEKLDPKDREKLETYKKGVAGGVTGVAVGGLTAALGHAAGKVKEHGQGEVQGQVREQLKKVANSLPEEGIRKSKAVGLAALGTGAALATASGIAYGVKKRKVKRKLEEEEKDDSAKK